MLGLFLFCFVISICTELLCFGRGIRTTCRLIIVLEDLAALKRAMGGTRPTQTGWLLRRLLLLRRCCGSDGVELLLLLLLRLLNDLCC